MKRQRGPPGRETTAAESTERRIWYGYGTLGRAEKDPLGMFLQDVIRIYGEVTVISLPILLLVHILPAGVWYDATGAALVAWILMTLVGTLIRGGWVQPLATDTPGWVTLSPWLLVLRVLYFNVTFVVAAFGGVFLGAALGWTPVSVLWAGAVAILSMLFFPRTGEETASRFGRYY
ncbi:hypothetical protein [Natranaeroarchaeum sulfidigenes]|uniref:DUF8215 domain-containing protein n=1 Tax=Natranaeroarchaeum sulfidigenes TaxID=2784880 RepID=A0A897MUJ5_9EURY|nr:hypothetical protein [Natranaeroarchaeum sulfidigenes]QSG04147.1 hypothetical protein AArcS_2960 [Natranaeroarchaeum sulfidigenes]